MKNFRFQISNFRFAAGLVLAGCLTVAGSCSAQPPKPSVQTKTVLLAAAAEPAKGPATAPAQPPLPAGHPDISKMTAPKGEMGKLPAGHPDVSQMQPATRPGMPGALPAGHPDVAGKTPAMGQLPAGHPEVPNRGSPAGPVQTKSEPKTEGSLLIRVGQGTKGGPPIGALPVTVDMQAGGREFEPTKAVLSQKGMLHLPGLPVDKPLSAMVRLEYAGVEYTQIAPDMDSTHADQVVDLTVYETTETEPAWRIQMQHLNMGPTDGGLRVELMVAVDAPGDHAWIGKPGPDGQRATLVLPLPVDAKAVELGVGFHACCARVQPGRVTEMQAVVPGLTKYRLGYTIPVTGGSAEIAIKTVAPVQNLVMFMPAGLKTKDVVGVEPMDAAAMGTTDMQFFRAADLPAGKEVKVTVTNVPASRAGAGGPGPRGGSRTDDTARIAQYVAGTGGVLIVLLGGAFILVKSSKGKKKAA